MKKSNSQIEQTKKRTNVTNKVAFKDSIRFAILGIIINGIILTGLLMLATYWPNIEKSTKKLAYNYIEDLAVNYGESIENAFRNYGDGALKVTYLEKALGNAQMKGIDSSYVYLTDLEGTMLYHPNSEKIGQKVENEAIQAIINQESSGQTIEPQVITYKYNGESKFAGVYVGSHAGVLLVVTGNSDELFNDMHTMNRHGAYTIVFGIIICGAIGAISMRRITKPLMELSDYLDQLSNLDLSESETANKLAKRKDEIGVMVRATQKFREELIRVVTNFKRQTSLVNSAAENLADSTNRTTLSMEQVTSAVNDISKGATSQAEDTQEASASVISMGDLINDVNSQVHQLTQYAEDMEKHGSSATTIFDELDVINKQAEIHVAEVAAQTDRTNESVENIRKAIDLITSIAEETNLLSLNASIEAARAGEHGRGFAVVADQIQKLSEQSNNSAKDIEVIVAQLLTDSEQAVKIMEQVMDIIHRQSECVTKSSEAFQSIQASVHKSLSGINEISEHTEQLNDARTTVIDVVQGLTAIAEENAAATEETYASVEEVSDIVADISAQSEQLDDISNHLQKDIEIFKF